MDLVAEASLKDIELFVDRHLVKLALGVKSLIIAFPKPGPPPDLVAICYDTGTSTFTIRGKKHRVLR
jgi:hypothetical protein